MTEGAAIPRFSIIIPARNEAEYIERCVRSCLENDYPADRIEVLVADGMSTDPTRDIVSRLASEDPRVRLIENPRRVAPSGMNVGIRAATGDVLVILGGHATVSKNFMAEMARILREHPDVWRAGGVVETVSSTYIGKVIAAAQSSPIGVGPTNWRLGIREGYVAQVCFAAVPRFVFDKVGLYDEELVRNQDDEFIYRVKAAGGKQYMTQSVRVKYFARGTLRKLSQQYYQYGFWRIRTIQKHKRPAHLRQVLPILFVLGWFVLIAGGFIWWPIWLALAAYAALYVAGLAVNVFWVARRDDWAVALLTPLACAAMHFAYGLGALSGFWSFVVLRGRFVPKPEAHGLSR